MDAASAVLGVYIGGTVFFIAGVFIGRLIERIKWNDLIKKGILPTPRSALADRTNQFPVVRGGMGC